LNWSRVGYTTASWVLSPAISGTLSATVFTIVCFTTLGNNFTLKSRVLSFTLITAVSFGLTSFMVMGLVARNVPFTEVYLAIISFFIIGLFGSRLFLILKAN
jgi:phosphate/sulfate permease